MNLDKITMHKELEHLLGAIERSDFNDYPYEHFYATEVFSEGFYERILNELPSDEDYFYLMHQDCILDKEKGISARLRCPLPNDRLIGVWNEVSEIFHSEELRVALFNKFKKTVKADPCDPHVSLMRDKKQYKILPHPDSRTKVITTQMYLPHDNSHEDVGTLVNIKSGDKFTNYKQFPFHRNTYYAFSVGEESYHSVDAVDYESFDRNTLMTIYYKEGKAPKDGY